MTKTLSCTQLELAVLGAIALAEPCTAYSVRNRFSKSLAQVWNSNSGAIYPTVRKLTNRSLILAEAEPSDRRGRQLLRLSSSGKSLLRKWLLKKPDPGEIIPSDPVRFRLILIGALGNQKDRSGAFSALSDAIRDEQKRCKERISASAGTTDEIMAKSVEMQLRTQQATMELMQLFFEETPE